MTVLQFNGSEFVLPHTSFRSIEKIAAAIDMLLGDIHQASETGLHLGAGGVSIPGLVNCDLYDERADRKIDALDLREFADGSVCLIETHHMIEHLSFVQSRAAFAEWRRVLKRGGLLIITCPDLTAVCEHWLALSRQQDSPQKKGELEYALKMLFGSQENVAMFHKCGFDAPTMKKNLNEFGFRVRFSHTPYQLRTTPSLFTIAQKAD